MEAPKASTATKIEIDNICNILTKVENMELMKKGNSISASIMFRLLFHKGFIYDMNPYKYGAMKVWTEPSDEYLKKNARARIRLTRLRQEAITYDKIEVLELRKKTPHIMRCIGNSYVGNNSKGCSYDVIITSRFIKNPDQIKYIQHYLKPTAQYVNFLILEYTSAKQLIDYFSKKDKYSNQRSIYILLFQLIYTLYVLNKNKIVHCDLHVYNSFVEKVPATDIEYQVGEFVYKLEGVCEIIKIFDFDRSETLEKTYIEYHDALSDDEYLLLNDVDKKEALYKYELLRFFYEHEKITIPKKMKEKFIVDKTNRLKFTNLNNIKNPTKDQLAKIFEDINHMSKDRTFKITFHEELLKCLYKLIIRPVNISLLDVNDTSTPVFPFKTIPECYMFKDDEVQNFRLKLNASKEIELEFHSRFDIHDIIYEEKHNNMIIKEIPKEIENVPDLVLQKIYSSNLYKKSPHFEHIICKFKHYDALKKILGGQTKDITKKHFFVFSRPKKYKTIQDKFKNYKTTNNKPPIWIWTILFQVVFTMCMVLGKHNITINDTLDKNVLVSKTQSTTITYKIGTKQYILGSKNYFSFIIGLKYTKEDSSKKNLEMCKSYIKRFWTNDQYKGYFPKGFDIDTVNVDDLLDFLYNLAKTPVYTYSAD